MRDPTPLRYILILLAVYAAWVALYSLTAWIGALRGPVMDPSLAVDAAIPFVPALMPVYFLAYVIVLGLFVISREPAFLDRAYRTIIIANACAFVIFALVPSQGPPREALLADGGGMVSLLHALDSRYNALPSLHVANPWLVALLCGREKGVSGQTFVFWALALGISAATLLVKQHYVLDVAAGAALAVTVFVLTCRRDR